MAITIWKSKLELVGLQEIAMPRGSEILCAQNQFEEICIWYRCDSDEPLEPRKFAIVGTGNFAPSDEDSQYIGSVQQSGGSFIWHIFEPRNV